MKNKVLGLSGEINRLLEEAYRRGYKAGIEQSRHKMKVAVVKLSEAVKAMKEAMKESDVVPTEGAVKEAVDSDEPVDDSVDGIVGVMAAEVATGVPVVGVGGAKAIVMPTVGKKRPEVEHAPPPGKAGKLVTGGVESKAQKDARVQW